MQDWTKRLAFAALLGFVTFFFALPVSCCGLVLYNEHLHGDVQAGGPGAILKAMSVSAALACIVMVLVWRRSGRRR